MRYWVKEMNNYLKKFIICTEKPEFYVWKSNVVLKKFSIVIAKVDIKELRYSG